MTSQIIQIGANDNCANFSHLVSYFQENLFHHLKDDSMTKLTLRQST
jgi:hypothetical protein